MNSLMPMNIVQCEDILRVRERESLVKMVDG